MIRLFILSSGKYGSRIVNNIAARGFAPYIVGLHEYPEDLPEFIDDFEDFIPKNLPESDLVLSLGLYGDINMTIPTVASKTHAKSIIAPIHDPKQIPPGLQRQIEDEIKNKRIIFPKPFCSLKPVQDKYIDEFASSFGKPELEIDADGIIKSIEVKRGAPCGSTWYIAKELEGVPTEEAEFESGNKLHNYPCLASMSIDPTVGDTIMHLAGYKIKEAVKSALGFATRSAVVDHEICQGGEACDHICYEVCPTIKIGDKTIIIEDNKKATIDAKSCGCCGICVKNCPFCAIEIIDERMALKK